MVTFTERQLDILFKLWRNRCFKRNATLQIDNVVKGAPSHFIGEMRKETDEYDEDVLYSLVTVEKWSVK